MMSGGLTAASGKLADTLNRFARHRLGHFPTPVESLPRLGRSLGVELSVKRDDNTGPGGGGNKVRKLEFLLAAALASRCDTVLTAGAIQSNHARITAAAAASLGLKCELVLTTPEIDLGSAYSHSGNRLLDALFGARVHTLEAGEESAPALAARASALQRDGYRPFVIPIGGSNGTGTLGYLAAALELAEQQALRSAFDVIVLPSGSGGTHAGLALGAALLGQSWQVIGISVGRDAQSQQTRVAEIIDECCRILDLPTPPAFRVEVFDGARGPGYGQPSTEMRDAVLDAARYEGLLLDPVYTGKAFAGLKMLVASGRIPRGARVLFWHTGGVPALFGYPKIFSENGDDE